MSGASSKTSEVIDFTEHRLLSVTDVAHGANHLASSKSDMVAPARPDEDTPGAIGTPRICTNPRDDGFLDNRFFDGIPVRTKDFSQSCEDGPRMSPSMYAKPGHRVQLAP
jgi:hypothetical protein